MRFDPFLPRVSSPVFCRESLLCNLVALPTVPFFRGTGDFLRLKWVEAGEALANQQGTQACQIFLSTAEQTPSTDSGVCNFLLDAAYRLLADNYQTAADHCIQKSLSLLSCNSERSRGTFRGWLWLVMAGSALSCRNLESCDLWLRQARQSLLQSNVNPRPHAEELQRWHGDWFAIEACRQAASGDLGNAESLLNRAHQCHMRAQAFTSAAKDRLLRSRSRLLEQQWDAAESDLAEAQSLIKRPGSADEDLHRIKLCRAIDNDLRSVRTKTETLFAAKWN